MPKNKNTLDTSRAKAISPKDRKTIAKRAESKHVNALIKGEIYNELRAAIIQSEKEGANPFYKDFIRKIVREGLKDVNSPIGRLWAEQILQPDIITLLDMQTEKYLNKDIDFMQFRLQKRLFAKQKEVFNDFVSRKMCVMCSRRAGKTELNVDFLLRAAAVHDSPVLYINLTFDNAIKQVFDKVVEEAARTELGIKSKSKSNGFIEFVNGSSISFKGNKDKSEADKLQGFKFRLVIIDEAQSQCNMFYLVNTIIEPTLLDYDDSVLMLTGTPPRRKGTFFEMAYCNKSFTQYSWNLTDNPFLHNSEIEIKRICEEKGVTEDSAFIQREYYGKIVYDSEAQVFKNYQVYSGTVPIDFWPTHIYTGVDFGFADYNGIVTLAANVQERKAYVIYERKFNKATITQIVDVIREAFETGKKFLIERNNDADLSNCQIFTDTNEKSITYELSQTYGLPAYCAYKYDKAMAMEQLAECCRTGRIMNVEGGECAAEFEQTLYKRDDLDNITSELDDGFHPDITEALLYASRQFFFDCGLDGGGESGNKRTGEF